MIVSIATAQPNIKEAACKYCKNSAKEHRFNIHPKVKAPIDVLPLVKGRSTIDK